MEAAARLGHGPALKELQEAPECPEELEYLVEWVYALTGRSGRTMDGHALPLTYQEVESFSRVMQHDLDPLEVAAILTLDYALLHPEPDEEEREEEQEAEQEAEQERADVLPLRRPKGAWPEKRREATQTQGAG